MSFRRPSSEAKEHSGVVKFFCCCFANKSFSFFYLANHDCCNSWLQPHCFLLLNMYMGKEWGVILIVYTFPANSENPDIFGRFGIIRKPLEGSLAILGKQKRKKKRIEKEAES